MALHWKYILSIRVKFIEEYLLRMFEHLKKIFGYSNWKSFEIQLNVKHNLGLLGEDL